MAAEQLQVYLTDSSTLDPFQCGFRMTYGTDIALVNLADQLWALTRVVLLC